MSTKMPMTSVFEDNPFVDGLFDYMNSPEGILREQVREMIWEVLDDVKVDAVEHRLLWSADEALSVAQSAKRIYQDVVPGQGVTLELIEEEIYGWLEMGYVPEGYTEKQLEQFEQKVSIWIEDYEESQGREMT